MNYQAEAQAMQDQLVAWRRDLHMHPELGFKEARTSGLVAAHLGGLGYQVHTGIAQTGVIGVLAGEGRGPAVMLRFDMDALPIQEESDVAYASRTPGVMHACGHDGHVAIGLGVATLLARHRKALNGAVGLLFQPAEELLTGAEAMLGAGALEDYRPRPDAAFGLHLWTPLPLGQAGLAVGPVFAAADRWTLKVRGRGGHGALPHETADPIVAATQIVSALQSIVSRNVNPQETAVLTVGSIHGGTAFNIIPGEVELTGTIRVFDAATHAMLLARFEALCQGMAAAMDVEANLQVERLVPAVVNDPRRTSLMHQVAREVLGPENVLVDYRTMVSEDMAYFLQQAPGAFMLLGAGNVERGLDRPHHHPCFDIDERALPLGVAILAETATRFLNQAV